MVWNQNNLKGEKITPWSYCISYWQIVQSNIIRWWLDLKILNLLVCKSRQPPKPSQWWSHWQLYSIKFDVSWELDSYFIFPLWALKIQMVLWWETLSSCDFTLLALNLAYLHLMSFLHITLNSQRKAFFNLLPLVFILTQFPLYPRLSTRSLFPPFFNGRRTCQWTKHCKINNRQKSSCMKLWVEKQVH
jgi:hypothetical protein